MIYSRIASELTAVSSNVWVDSTEVVEMMLEWRGVLAVGFLPVGEWAGDDNAVQSDVVVC